MDPQTADGVVRIIEAFGQSNLAVIGLTLTLVWWMLKSFKSAITQRQDDQEKTLDRIHSCLLAMLANQNEKQKNTTVAYRFTDLDDINERFIGGVKEEDESNEP